MDVSHHEVVDFWFDPVCPYSWTASRWLREVQQHRQLRVRGHVMSLYLLNEHRTDVEPAYRANVEATRGPSRVATAAVARFGEQVLDGFIPPSASSSSTSGAVPATPSTTLRSARR